MSDLRDCMRNYFCDKLFDWAFVDDEDDLNKALLQASDEFELKIMLVQQLHPWLWLHLKLCLEQVLPTTNQTQFLPAPLQDQLITCIVKSTTVALQKLEPYY